MFRKTLFFLLFFVLVASPAISAPHSLKINEIEPVMERLFNFHIENKEFTPTLVRRSMKIYIEQFDPDKAYLTASDTEGYLNMSDERASEVLYRLKNNDYSDFMTLNGIMQKSILRARSLRALVAKQLINGNFAFDSPPSISPKNFVRTEEELIDRQAGRMVRFYMFHQSHTKLDTLERKNLVFSLFEKKVQRNENMILFADMPQDQIEHQLTLRMLKSFAKSLDTHTAFFSPEEAYEMRMSLEKQFEGVGVVLSEGVDGVLITELIKGSPAEQSGQIQVNDLLVEIDGKSIRNASFEDVLNMLKKKDEFILGFKRREDFFRIALQRRPIVMNDDRIEASYETSGDGIIGKIALHSFYENSDGSASSEKDIREAIRLFREKGELRGLVLDLRENSGGFLSQAVKVAGLFMSNGVVVISKYGQKDVHYLRNITAKPLFNGPLVILTSKMSASAAEIVAQALQDYGVALIVGDQRTFGKGSIQYQTVTDGKADMFFKVTVGRYYTPSGKSTQIDGVIADIVVPSGYAPYKIGEQYLEYPLPRDKVASAFVDPLTDLDDKTRKVFQQRYLPYSQRVVSFWKSQLPTLRQSSAARLQSNPEYQKLLKHQEAVSERIKDFPPNAIDENVHSNLNDLQMGEAVHIVQDMIYAEAQSELKAVD